MRFALQRTFATIFVLWGVCTITFFLLHLTPGDPVELMMKKVTSTADMQAIRHDLGLDQPISKQYFIFLDKLLHGDLGRSYSNRRPVLVQIRQALPGTFVLAAASMLFAIIIGIPLGVWSAVKEHTWFDSSTEFYSLLGLSMPSFWLAPLLIIIFAIKLDWFPVNEQEGISSLVLPSMSLGLGLSAVILRMTRAAMLEVMNEEYIRVARAKGLGEKTVFFKHALKNAMTPIVTILSLQFGAVLTGLVITETIFDWPGLGVLLYNGLLARDYPLVQGCVMTIAVIYVLVNLFTDFAYLAVNPRLRGAP
jgi:peptide/nickel transport system permease protein